ncbi:hypothetical protein CONPUDRAFT_94286 [Coniophora puteana RWD-64-598 SS2]|uniref:E3 ubiquitin-protein ligase n=1 Tax=Coniophora puteana (strain RWD-64-598) TaxID=741705 RepID=A0A5M3N3N1_CONPW|nr:uncharacterized protein CONPUDRAFT_94286 [Coniophora puteana RWD-64-598 SS2]EIW86012.1 hypothetical protein CONPUDRAFT_94286 [Coniophora puteana RWD-64-598 SS2]
MSGFSFFPSKFLSSMSPRDRPSDPLSRLRFALETMPGSRKYVFTPATRAEILTELYDAFWGAHPHLFLPLSSNASLTSGHALLSEAQASVNFGGAGLDNPPVQGRPCGHIFTKGESCFRCKDCALDDSCVLCSRCFHASDHSDHNVSFFIAQQSGGCCDCGDVEAWRQAVGCPLHPPSTEAQQAIAAELAELRFIPGTTARPIMGVDVPPVPAYPHRAQVPPELREQMSRTIAYALDFLLDTLDYSPDEPNVPSNEADLRLQRSADPMQKEQYCLVLWNDDKHSFDEVIEVIVETTGRDRAEADGLSRAIDERGREIIDMHSNVAALLDAAQRMAKIELGVTVRRAYDTFREQVAVVLIEWLLDLTKARMSGDALIISEILVSELLSPRKREGSMFSGSNPLPEFMADVNSPCRIDWLFLYHTRLWKKPRINLKEMYASILTINHAHKLAMGSHFANVYHRVVDAYLLVDREAETSIKYFALQLFTVPSVSSYIVRNHNIVSRLLDIITGFFTNQIQGKHILPTQPSSTAAAAELDVESFPFKSKRFMPVFSDLRYLCHNTPVQALIATHHGFIRDFARVCALFMCVNPNRRAASSHVEYETDAWISVFNVTLSLARVVKVYGAAFAKATPAALVAAITEVVHEILMVCTLVSERLDRSKYGPPVFHAVEFAGAVYQVVQFDVLEGWVSFHHALHWLLAELVKHVDLLDESALKEVGLTGIRDVFLRNASEQAILTMIDFPLRVLAMIAQIRAGLWVRNGFPIRGQLLHYRDFMLRELCYDQDIFVVQSAFVILDPDTVLVSILDRFGLVTYFTGELHETPYEPAQQAALVEEALGLIITLLSERGAPSQTPLPAAVRREIIHALAMGPATFTDLVKRVAERMVDDVCFERVLREVAHFRAPESTTDTGTYELREELFGEVNPFFYHYTRNKREEVEVVLKAWLRRTTGEEDPVIVPKPLGIEKGPFSILPVVFQSEALLQVMFFAIYNVLDLTEEAGSPPPSAEAILDEALHLIMLALVEKPDVFTRLAAVRGFATEVEDGENPSTNNPNNTTSSLLDVICLLEHDENYKTYKARCAWILERFSQHVPDEVRERRKIEEIPDIAAPDPASARKATARARQDALMKRMKEQQAQFADNFDAGGDDESTDDAMSEVIEEPETFGTCIVCTEELTSARAFGSLGLVQASRFLRKHPDSQSQYLNELMNLPDSLDGPMEERDMTFPPKISAEAANIPQNFDAFPAQYTRFGLHAGVCGHMMHLECFQVYSVSIRQRHRQHATRNHPENIPRKEFICPLCKSLGNILLPVSRPPPLTKSTIPFPDWIRAAGIGILKSKPDAAMDALQFRNGTGEFVFWSAQDPGYSSSVRKAEASDVSKMLDSIMTISKNVSQQTRHLRDRPEPDTGERGAGIYLPEELIGYTLSSIEVGMRGVGDEEGVLADHLTESQTRMIRGMLSCLNRLGALELNDRADGGRESIKQAIIKRLLPEWSRTSLTSFSYPLLLRDPLTILVETAAVAPDMLQHVLVLTYYACLARTVIGMVYVLNKARSTSSVRSVSRNHQSIFGDIRVFFMSVVRHSPIFDHNAMLVFETFGEARIEKMLYAYTLPFLRRAALLCRAVAPNVFPTPTAGDAMSGASNEYERLLSVLGIPPLADLPNQDTLQNALSGWCAHYGHSHAASQLNCGVVLDYAGVYQLASLPTVLDDLFSGSGRERLMKCQRCGTVPADAVICLICGAACCMLSHCCFDSDMGRGECNMHLRECGGAIGVYFVVKRCALLYVYPNLGTFVQSPYLDAHGEVDTSMRRGRRQYLHPARWEEIRKTWINHSIPTVIARKLESSVDNGGWETL